MRRFVNLPKYDILRRIGRGAGAVIYEARERSTRQSFAVKHVVRKGPEQDRFIAQAEREYEIGHQLDHPSLRKFYEIVRVRRWLKTTELFLVMEYVDGETLESQYKGHPAPASLERPVQLFIEVARGLAAVHRHGFVHADIKPNNILVRGDTVRIIDFGQSCPIGHRKERVQGTPDFIAPEQVNRHPLDTRTDVFNLGATMYWVATGKWYRTMLNRGATAEKKIEIDARTGSDPPDQVNPHVSKSLSRLILDCCEVRPDDRPSDMRHVLSRLEMILHLMTRPPMPPEALVEDRFDSHLDFEDTASS